MPEGISADAVMNGTGNAEGQPVATGTNSAEGQPISADAQTKGEPTAAAGLLDGMTAEQLHKSYKELQREFGARNEQIKSFEGKLSPFGGADQMVRWAEYLSKNPRFNEWIEQEKQRQILGTEGQEIDDETKKAVSVVEKIANQKIQAAMNEQVTPLANEYKARMLKENMTRLDEKYGIEWREAQNDMAEIAKNLPPAIQDNPSFEDLADLYVVALRRTGKLEEAGKRQYEKMIREKQAKTTDKPATAPVTIGEVRSMRDAFEAAKRMAG